MKKIFANEMKKKNILKNIGKWRRDREESVTEVG